MSNIKEFRQTVHSIPLLKYNKKTDIYDTPSKSFSNQLSWSHRGNLKALFLSDIWISVTNLKAGREVGSQGWETAAVTRSG